MVTIGNGKFGNWITPDGLLCIEGWAREGMTEAQIAAKIGVSMSTLSEWKLRFPEVTDALKRGKAPVDVKVENALLKRALGYDYEEVTEEYTDDGVDAEGKPKMKKHVRRVMKHVSPDVTAQIYWLNNRRPDRWRNRREEQVTVTGADYSLIDAAAKEIAKAAGKEANAEPDAE